VPFARRLLPLVVGGALACGCQTHDEPPPPLATTSLTPRKLHAVIVAPSAPGSIELRDAADQVTGSFTAGPPCRLVLGGDELVVNNDRATLSGESWKVTDAANGATAQHGDQPIARAYAGAPNELSVIDPEGVPFFTAVGGDDHAQLSGRTGVPLRALAVVGGDIEIHGLDDKLIARALHTHDLMLAALLTSPEVSPEARALLACHRIAAAAAPTAAPASESTSP
jgi:hypothetical protein